MLVYVLATIVIVGSAYLVGLVVVLRVVFKHLRLLLVVKGADQLLDADASVLGPPFLAVDEPWTINTLNEYVSSSQCAYIFLESSTLNLRARRNRS